MKARIALRICALTLLVLPALAFATPIKLLCEITWLSGSRDSLVYTLDPEQGTFTGPFPPSWKVEVTDDYISVSGRLGASDSLIQINRLSGEYQRFATRDGVEKQLATGSCSAKKQAF